MATFAGGTLGFRVVIAMALGTGQFLVILVKDKLGHDIVVEAQGYAFPPFVAVAFGTLQAKGFLMRIILFMAGNAGTGDVV